MTDETPIPPPRPPIETIEPRTAGHKALKSLMTASKAHRLYRMCRARKAPPGLAQGFVDGQEGITVPYRFDQEKIDGGIVHFWLGSREATEDLLTGLCQVAIRSLSAIGFTYSQDDPTGFEAYKLLRR